VNHLRKFSKKFEVTLMLFSVAWGKMINEKNLKQKTCDTVPLRDGQLNTIGRRGQMK
jgi:hypothetical protein